MESHRDTEKISCLFRYTGANPLAGRWTPGTTQLFGADPYDSQNMNFDGGEIHLSFLGSRNGYDWYMVDMMFLGRKMEGKLHWWFVFPEDYHKNRKWLVTVTPTYLYIHACMHTYMHTCMHTCIHTCIHAYMHTCMHACMQTYVRTYIHTYIYIYTHMQHIILYRCISMYIQYIILYIHVCI